MTAVARVTRLAQAICREAASAAAAWRRLIARALQPINARACGQYMR